MGRSVFRPLTQPQSCGNAEVSMRIARLGVALVMMLGSQAAMPASAEAQLGAIRRRAEEAKKKIDSASKKKAEDSARARPDSTKSGGAAPATAAQPTASSAAPAAADPKVWDNYDFVPGNRVIFF